MAEAEIQGRPLFRVGQRRFAIFNAELLDAAYRQAAPRYLSAG
jgi:hypothetical protein